MSKKFVLSIVYTLQGYLCVPKKKYIFVMILVLLECNKSSSKKISLKIVYLLHFIFEVNKITLQCNVWLLLWTLQCWVAIFLIVQDGKTSWGAFEEFHTISVVKLYKEIWVSPKRSFLPVCQQSPGIF